MRLNNFNLHTFSLVFFIVGMPILYAIREYIPNYKFIFTYSVVFIMLLTLINYKNLLKLKFYSNKPIIFNFLIGILLLLYIFYALMDQNSMLHNTEIMYLVIIFFIFISLLTRKNTDYEKLPLYFLVLSSLSQIISIALTPTDPSYWALHGGAFYVGDTKNSNLTSFISILNIIIIIYYLISVKRMRLIYKISLLAVAALSTYLYITSFSKSAILGLVLIGIYYLFLSKDARRYLYKKTPLILIILIIGYVSFSNVIIEKIDETTIAYDAMMHGGDTHSNSGAVRHENYLKSQKILANLGYFNGEGIFQTQADNAILQAFTDLGYFIGFISLFVILLIPFYILYKQLRLLNSYKQSNLYDIYIVSIMIYIFNVPNIFFHATPYTISIWIPLLMIYKFTPWKRNDKQ